MSAWQLQEAKSHFSELVERSLNEGPQWVTRRGREAVVVLAAPEYRRLLARPSLLATLQTAPRGEPLNLDRADDSVRAPVF